MGVLQEVPGDGREIVPGRPEQIADDSRRFESDDEKFPHQSSSRGAADGRNGGTVLIPEERLKGSLLVCLEDDLSMTSV